MSKGCLFVISGPSGTGKGTVCKELLANKDNNLFLSVSSTTREKRAGEVDGETYNYVTLEEFKRMIGHGEMLEYAVYSGNYYGTPKKAVEKMLAEGRNVILEIEPQGALKVKGIFPDAVLIFIIPPSMAALKQRLVDRNRETEDQIEKRLAAAKWEMEQAAKYNRIVVNDDLDACVCEIEEILRDNAKKRERVDNLLHEKY